VKGKETESIPSYNREYHGKVTLSGLLNALDGMNNGDGYIVFMTTNRRDLLDKALLRPGRVDYELFIDYATEKQVVRRFRQFFDGATKEDAETFASNLLEMYENVSIAELQGYLLLHKNSLECAMKKINRFRTETMD
jgi:chaperone BCS1